MHSGDGKKLYSKKLLAKRIAVTLAASSVLISGQAFAQDEDFQLDQVVVTATRVAQEASSVPADVTVVTAQQLEDKGARDLADALEGVPGVVISRSGTEGNFSEAFINGSNRIVYMIDGKRINIPQGVDSGQETMNLSTVLIAGNIEKIEIVRGGSSVLYGADAVGGVVNIITKKGVGQTTTSVTTGVGNHSAYQFGMVNQGSENGYHWYITGLKDKTDGQRPNNAYDGKNATVRIDKDLNDKQSLSFNFDYYGSHAGYPGTMVNNVWNTSNALDEFGDVQRHNWSIEYDNKRDNGNETIRFYNNNQIYSGYEYGANFHHENIVRSLEYQNNSKLNGQNLLTWGGTFTKEKVNSTNEGVEHDRNIWDGYLQDQYNWTPKFTMTTGARYEHNSQFGSKTLPKISFEYQADKKTSYFANWGKVFKTPTFDDLYWYDPDGFMLNNPNLKPETGWTSELGVKQKLDENNEILTSVFKQQLYDAIYWVDQGNYISKAENVDKLTSTGVNFTYNSKLSRNVSMNIGYTYLDSRKNDNENAGSPHNNFNIGLNIKQGKFTQTINGNYVDPKNYLDYYGSPVTVNSYFKWDTNLKYAFNKEQSVYLTINNIFDRKYEQVKGYPALERTIFFGVKQAL